MHEKKATITGMRFSVQAFLFKERRLDLLSPPCGVGVRKLCTRSPRIPPKAFSSVRVDRSRRPMFAGLQEGSVVLLAKGSGGSCAAIVRKEHESISELTKSISSTSGEMPFAESSVLVPERKIQSEMLGQSIKSISAPSLAKINTFCSPKNTSKVLSSEASMPPNTDSQLASFGVDAYEGVMAQACSKGERVWLFRPSDSLANSPAVARYLSLKVEAGGCDRSGKTCQEKTWYQRSSRPRPMPLSVECAREGLPWSSLACQA